MRREALRAVSCARVRARSGGRPGGRACLCVCVCLDSCVLSVGGWVGARARMRVRARSAVFPRCVDFEVRRVAQSPCKRLVRGGWKGKGEVGGGLPAPAGSRPRPGPGRAGGQGPPRAPPAPGRDGVIAGRGRGATEGATGRGGVTPRIGLREGADVCV